MTERKRDIANPDYHLSEYFFSPPSQWRLSVMMRVTECQRTQMIDVAFEIESVLYERSRRWFHVSWLHREGWDVSEWRREWVNEGVRKGLTEWVWVSVSEWVREWVWGSEWVSEAEWVSRVRVSEWQWVTVCEWESDWVSQSDWAKEWVTVCEWQFVSEWVSECACVCEGASENARVDQLKSITGQHAKSSLLYLLLSFVYLIGFSSR